MAFIPLIAAAASSVAAGAASTAAAVGTGIAGASTLAAASLPAIAGISTASVPVAAGASWMSIAGLGLTAASGLVGAGGAIMSGEAKSASAEYNAEVSARNKTQADRNAVIAGEAASEQTAIQSQKTRSTIGGIKANQAASGVDVNSGSAVDVRSSAAELGELDALTVRSNATKEAYGYTTQSANFGAQSELDKAEASNDETAGYLGAGTTLLSAAGTGASNFSKFQLQGGFG